MSALVIDPAADHPPFEQLRRQIIEQIRDRRLVAGDRLPPVRRLAAELDLAPNTVARAYRELEAEGYLITRGRAGTTVADVVPPDAAADARAAALAAEFVAGMRALGLGGEAIVLAVREAL